MQTWWCYRTRRRGRIRTTPTSPVKWALSQCEADGITWLFHVDDDELIHFSTPWASVARRIPETANCLVIENLEGVPHDLECDFTTISRFVTHHGDRETGECYPEDNSPMLAYINGKSAGRVGHSQVWGAHRFTGEEWHVPPADLCVLHFESIPYNKWRGKFEHYSKRTTDAKLKSIPFEFYVDSIKCFRDRPDDEDDDQRERQLRSFWTRRKKQHYMPYARKFLIIKHQALASDAPRFVSRDIDTGCYSLRRKRIEAY
jgi:hypothetical protein